MALNDKYRLRLSTAYDAAGSQIFQNVFYYEQVFENPGATGAAQLAVEFKAVVFPKILDVIHQQAHFAAFSVENVIPGGDNVFETYGTTDFVGVQGGECMPPYAAWAFRLSRVETDIRNGQKRFGPVSELDQSSGVAVGTVIPKLNTLSSGLFTTLGVVGTTSAYMPRIFRPASPSRTIPEKVIPAKLQLVRQVGQVNFVRLSTQNTRKFGRGT